MGQERLENPSILLSKKDLPHVDSGVNKEQLVKELKDEAKSRQSVEHEKMEKTIRGGPAAHVQSAADKLEKAVKEE